METLEQQVRQARRRLNIQRFLGYLPWCWCVTLGLAVVAIAVHKWFPTGALPSTWNALWLGGALLAGMLAAAAWTGIRNYKSLDAAIEIDRRFGLKERVSSSLSLSEHDRETEAGRAVITDAVRRAERLEISERFGISLGRRILLPLLPAALAFVIAFGLGEKDISDSAQANTSQLAQKKQVKKSTDALRKRIKEQRKDIAEKGLKDAEDALKEIDEGLKDLDKKNEGDRRQTMIKLNNLADKLQQKRDKLGGVDEMRRQLNKMKNLEKGPADKLARAMKDGKFNDALGEIEKLKQKLGDGNLSDEEKQQIAKQLEQMKDKLDQIANANQGAMDDLEQKIKEARESGDIAEADKLQQALDKLRDKMPQMDSLSEMANKLGQLSKAMKEGDNAAAQQALEKLAADLDQMQQEMDELETLDDTLDEIMQCKNAMNCKKCGGDGCGECQGGLGKGQGGGDGKNGDGLGDGKAGRGTRPIEEDKTSTYESRVRGKVGPGKAVITGQAQGPNAKGKVREAIQTEFESQDSGPADPLTGQKLPKSHRRLVKEYFESLRDGE